MKSFILIYRPNVSTTTLKRNVDANRLLRTRPTFSRSLMVSVAVSKLGSTQFFIFQQDSAPAPRAKDTIALLRRETPSFIGLELWPANSKDLNPVDYRIWGLIQERVYQTAIQNIYELKERLIGVWAELKQSVIDKAIEQWRPRLRVCVQAKGHHFEHLIK